MKTFKQFVLKKQVNFVKSKLVSLINNDVNESIEFSEDIWKDKELLNWLRSHGLEITGNPGFKKGGSGIAYFLPKNLVLKITDDIVEANIAKMIINSKVDNNIIDVKKINNQYAILQRKLDTKNTPENIKLAADLVTVMIDEFELSEFPDDKNKIIEMCNKIIDESNVSKNIISSMLLIISLISNLYKETGFFHNDAGPTNIGTEKGKTYIFDLGPNKTKDYSSEKEIEKINKKREKLGLTKHTFN